MKILHALLAATLTLLYGCGGGGRSSNGAPAVTAQVGSYLKSGKTFFLRAGVAATT
jgi:hypothetical protein